MRNLKQTMDLLYILNSFIVMVPSGESCYFKLASSLQKSLWSENQFVNLLYEIQLIYVHCFEWNKGMQLITS